MNTPMISVIVPIYNVESYLDRCIHSIIDQTWSNLEIILVDDGSPDHCPEICDRWANKDSRIRVIHKKNGGLSDARNAALAIANGEYISFVDSDDWLDNNMFSVLYTQMQQTNSQIAICSFLRVAEEDSIAQISDNNESNILDGDTALLRLIQDQLQQVVWNKLYHRSVVEDILFEVGKYHEDEFWSYQVFGRAKQVVETDYTGYFYRQRSDSIMGESYSTKRLDAIEAKCKRQKYLEQNKAQLAPAGRLNLLFSCIYHGQLALAMTDKVQEKMIIDKLRSIYMSEVNSEIPPQSLSHKVWLSIAKRNFKIACSIRNIMKIGC